MHFNYKTERLICFVEMVMVSAQNKAKCMNTVWAKCSFEGYKSLTCNYQIELDTVLCNIATNTSEYHELMSAI